MIHRPDYVKKLMKKQEAGFLTEAEQEELAIAWTIYTEEEWQEMVNEARLEMEQQYRQELQEGRQPDFEAIMKKGDRRRRRKKALTYGKRVALAGAVIGLIIAYVVPLLKKTRVPSPPVGDCADSSAVAIPLDGFSCMISWAKSGKMTVDNHKKGEIVRIQNVEIRQDAPGTLTLQAVPSAKVDTTGPLYIEVLTKANQQYMVVLPDGSRIRLNAVSTLLYPLINPDTSVCYVQLRGEAYVQVREKEAPEKLVVETANCQLHTAAADFSLSASAIHTSTTLLKGVLDIADKQNKPHQLMKQAGDRTVVYSYPGKDKKRTDSAVFSQHASLETALRWMKKTRIYRDASLREFVSDMGRWYGFAVNINCIPPDRRISVAICYRAPEDELFAVIKEKGMMYQNVNGVISFCDPNPRKSKRRDFTYVASLLWQVYH